MRAGEVGELWLRGPFLMEGYYGRERHETFTPDGWYRTGDLFHVDDDGFFYFTGRRGDMIKTAGANVSPREVEAAIADVDRARRPRRGRRRPRARPGGRGRAARAAGPGRRPTPTSCAPRCASGCRRTRCRSGTSSLADDEVPMLSSGKLDARALKERLR